MFIIYLFSDILILKIVLAFSPEKMWERLALLRFLTLHHHVFCLWFHAWNLLYVTSRQKQVTDISLVLKDSDAESENPSSLIWLSVSDG